MLRLEDWYSKYGLSENTVAVVGREAQAHRGMTRFRQWKEDMDPSMGANNETPPPTGQPAQPDEQWEHLKKVFGQDRTMADPSLVSKLESQPLKHLIPKVIAQYQGDKNEAAKEMIAALLKIMFGDQAGSGQAVSGMALSRQADAPLGNAAAAS